MITKGCGIIGLIAAAMLFPWTLDYASAADFVQVTKEVKLHPKAPVSVNTSSPISGKANVNEKFSQISNVCFRFFFVGDLLDPGDDLTIPGFAGFFNPTGSPQSDRTICVVSDGQAENQILSNFIDGKVDVTIEMETGSVTINSLSVTITGYSHLARREIG